MPTPNIETPPIAPNLVLKATDTETYLIEDGRTAPMLVCSTTAKAGEAGPKIFTRGPAMDVFRKDVQDEDLLLVIHNAPFDLGVFVQQDPSLLPWVFYLLDNNRIYDTMTAEKLVFIKRGWTEFDPVYKQPVSPATYALDHCVYRWLGESMTGKHGENSWRKRFSELDGVPLERWPEEAKAYALGDAGKLLRLAEAQIAEYGVLNNFWDAVRADFALQLFSAHGMITQEEVVREVEADVEAHVGAGLVTLHGRGIYKLAGSKQNPKLSLDTKLVKDKIVAYFDRVGEPVPMTKPKKRPDGTFPDAGISRDRETLEMTDDEDLLLLAEIGADKTLQTGFLLNSLKASRWPANPSYNVLVATGRTSSFDFNVQQLPKKGGIRESFVPRLGYIFVNADYDSAQLRTCSQIMINWYGHSVMGDTIAAGKGVHSMMGAALMSQMTGIPITYEEFEARRKAGDETCIDYRQFSKQVNFGAMGGIGAKTFAKNMKKDTGITITVEFAKTMLDLYRETWTEMGRYFQDIAALGDKPDIKQFGSQRERGAVDYCAICLGYIQGLEADGAKLACYRVAKECWLGTKWDDPDTESPLFGSYPVAFVHDEIMLESPFDRARAAAARLTEVMCQAMDVFTPDVPAKAEAKLMRRWYKGGDPAFDKDGELVPSAPKRPSKEFAKAIEKLDAGIRMGWLDDDRLLYDTWSNDEAKELDELLTRPGKGHEHAWFNMNRAWRWELLARKRNPDIWMSAEDWEECNAG